MPTRQRAAAVRLAHSAAMLAEGRRTWPSPDVLPWGAWLERELDRARIRGEVVPRRLSALEDWLLWREAVLQAGGRREMLAPERLMDAVRRAVATLEDYGSELPVDASPETALLAEVRDHYRRRCEVLGALPVGSWVACARYVRPSESVLLAGFAVVGPARRRWLERQGARVLASARTSPAPTLSEPTHPGRAPVQVVCAPTPAAEAEAAADWCAELIARDPQVRLLLVVPRLAEQRHLWQRALSQRLDYEDILRGTAALGPSAYAIEGGQPLDTYPLIAAALNLIALGADQAGFGALSALLRSPYLSAWDASTRWQLDVWLRQQNLDTAARATLQELSGRIEARLGRPAAELVQSLLAATAASAAPAVSLGSWAQLFATWLAAAGWPGPDLSSAQLQVRMRFDELLGELAAADIGARGLQLAQAAALLRELAARTAFEAASGDVAITVSSALEDPVVRYDGIWVAGLSAEVWPAAARPDPLLPLALQYAAGIPEASAEGQLQRSRQLQQLWLASASRCVLSWPASEEDLLRDASPLLRELQGTPEARPSASAAASAGASTGGVVPVGFGLDRWLAGLSPPLQPWRDIAGPRWPAGRALRGGTRLLELQGRCPFRAFAELRLAAQPLPLPTPGIDPRWRGQILHRALELFWREAVDQVALSDAHTVEALARRCAAQAIEELAHERGAAVPAVLLQRERARTEAVMAQLRVWERSRAHFVAETLEGEYTVSLGEPALRLRVDRIDRLDDGRLVVIDYKSGQPQPFDPLAERLEQPQLPVYAIAAGDAVAAVLTLHVTGDSTRVRGVADRRGRIHRLAPPRGTPWPQLIERWRSQLQQLLQEFLGGHAAVEPQPQACVHCHLQGLCRIDAQSLAVAAASEQDERDEQDEPTDEDGGS